MIAILPTKDQLKYIPINTCICPKYTTASLLDYFDLVSVNSLVEVISNWQSPTVLTNCDWYVTTFSYCVTETNESIIYIPLSYRVRVPGYGWTADGFFVLEKSVLHLATVRQRVG